MIPKVANIDNDAQIKIKAMDFILREICRNYTNSNEAIFTHEQVKGWLRGLGPEYIELNIKDLI
jgi:hypothetical protein